MNIIGISCFYHDAAACLIRDGIVIAAAQEERFNRKKNCADFPLQAVNYCLQAGGICMYDVDRIVFYEKPFLKFSRVIQGHIAAWPMSLPNFMSTMPHWLQDRLIMPLVCKRELGYEGKTLFIKHHLSHAASAFLVSPFEDAAIVTADSVGEWAAMTIGSGSGSAITVHKEMRYPDSAGLFYTAVTTYLGFEALEGEGKVMGLAAYGKPRYLADLKEIVDLKADGSLRIDQRYFGFNTGRRMFSAKFVERFGPAREPESEITDRDRDMAASVQAFIEEALLAACRHAGELTRSENLCLAGGLFLNCVANDRIREGTRFKNIYIQPAAGDAGGALGAAAYAAHAFFGAPRTAPLGDACIGPEYSSAQIRRALEASGLSYTEYDDETLFRITAQRIFENRTVGWFQGRMEFGPRALGNRSILGNPCNPAMKDILNNRVKHREPFRPFAPVIPLDRCAEFFELDRPSPFMLLSPRVRQEKCAVIPAATHVDGTARVQTITPASNPRLHRLIEAFERLSAVPVLINTSFNLRGEPLVCTPQDAIACFRRTGLDCLALGNCFVEKCPPA